MGIGTALAACAIAQEQPQAAVEPARPRSKAIGARSSSVSALPRWTKTRRLAPADVHAAKAPPVVHSGSGRSFAGARRIERRASTAVRDGRLPLGLAKEQRRGYDPGSLLTIVPKRRRLP